MGHFHAWGDWGFSPGLNEEDVEQWYGKDKDGRGHNQAEIHLPARRGCIVLRSGQGFPDNAHVGRQRLNGCAQHGIGFRKHFEVAMLNGRRPVPVFRTLKP